MDQSPSITAYLVANGSLNLLERGLAAHLVPGEAVPYLRAFVNAWRGDRKTWIKHYSIQLTHLEKPITLGIEEHYACRKRLIERKVKEFIAAGGKQVVNVSAGFDTLAIRLCEPYSSTDFFEIDHPATQQTKIAALGRLSPAMPDNLHFISCDHTKERVADKLLNSSFDEEKPSFFIIEGLSMYLNRRELSQLLKDIHVSCRNSRVAIGMFGNLLNKNKILADNNLQKVYESLEHVHEGYRFSCPYELAPDFLKELGFEVRESFRMGTLQQDFRTPQEIEQINRQINAENYFIAESVPFNMGIFSCAGKDAQHA